MPYGESHIGRRACNSLYAFIMIYVCASSLPLYIPAIVDRHLEDFYMQKWTFVNRGRPRIGKEVQ